MKTCSKSPAMLLIYIMLLPVLEAQELKMQPEVTGYLGEEVTLRCQFIPGPKDDIISQVEWELKTPAGEEITIIVSSVVSGISVHNSSLKERVKIAEQSLIIGYVEKGDAGWYTCSVAAFPSGSFEGTTQLIVQEQKPLSAGTVSAIVIAVMLLLGIVAAIVYFIFIRKRDQKVIHRVYIDTDGPVMDVSRQSVLKRDVDVVYSDVRLKTFRDAPPDEEHTADDVTYAEVVVVRHQLQ
ncbi:nectin-3-like protein [Gymnodraco acuticeps]|uniref:Nectin-3-like protein n=1 Tax=Gymnodraco acuticeps TaxID=8218 RepID=A0A6P8UM65_GYMAC|nr:nectin-3-like protein [Gymnodraco acuticeps]XP_034077482.1 nectin-3-like protein [Gymnodraco acuticeps]